MKKDSKEYKDFSDNLLCVAEHTCGMDAKTFFALLQTTPPVTSAYKHGITNVLNIVRICDKISVAIIGIEII